ncbi:MAG: 1-acyl-sn-glycerol-3-phosphate acyltransferase [Treponema sp.]|jgi:1-acyl-sn-glycerol-3-phosphate acyltransferase|nr:1-acyl-sn-glycerol-3-phosphate acyltransferase [Treponema sp.]
MAIIRTILVVLVFLVALFGFLPLVLVAFVLSFLGLKKSMAMFTYRLAQGAARAMIFFTGCSLNIQGRENIPRKDGVCFVSNHVGLFDIVLALAFIGRPFGFVAKRELLYAPFVNIWIWLLGGLFMDRKNLKRAHHAIEEGVKRIKTGGGMIIFPEGTRSRSRGLQPFRSGSFKLATKAEAVIIPMTINGTYDVFERTNLIQKTPLDVIFGKPISTTDIPYEERKQVLSDKVHGIIEETLKTTYMSDLNRLNR